MTKEEPDGNFKNMGITKFTSRIKPTPFFIISISAIIYAIWIFVFIKKDPLGFWQIPFFVSISIAVLLWIIGRIINTTTEKKPQRIIIQLIVLSFVLLLFYKDLALLLFGIEM